MKHLPEEQEDRGQAVAPLSDEGRGLKPDWCPKCGEKCIVAPLSDEGRGLKLKIDGKNIAAVPVAPLSDEGRGLKLLFNENEGYLYW